MVHQAGYASSWLGGPESQSVKLIFQAGIRLSFLPNFLSEECEEVNNKEKKTNYHYIQDDKHSLPLNSLMYLTYIYWTLTVF